MRIHKLILKEMFQRSNQLITSLLAITLGIAVIVGIKNITVYSEKAVSKELDTLGANILILPKSATIQDYYSADFQEESMPESYVHALTNSDLKGIENLSPKLSVSTEIKGHKTILTGILPKNEFKSKAAWQGSLGIFERCASAPIIPGLNDMPEKNTRKRVIDDLGRYDILAGSDVANTLNIKENDTIVINEKSFQVKAVLPMTGTIDDDRIFTHLHTVQEFYDKKGLLNIIEIVGCCLAMSEGLIQKINKLLPDAKVVTITQIVRTQLNTNKLMNKLSLIMLIIIILIGTVSIANYMFANVYERRREIGIMMAMGAKPFWLIKIFMLKSLFIGIMGGVFGYILGSILAFIMGPKLAGIPVLPMPLLAGYSLLIASFITVIASFIPVFKAAKIDPCLIMQEE
ncbi:MAG: ABC transporter permease [Desulfobacterales bacterium]|nr:ABC transporter permease [Desulfobacterales bacterium]